VASVVVGAGVIGTALARRLAEDGWRVTVVERHHPAHQKAASSAESRLIRKHAPALAEHGADLLTGADLPQAIFALPRSRS
jgi:2-polyprenyl-6-methoxyphenol hydroxylase-like FAD-dependent oxidoreductase